MNPIIYRDALKDCLRCPWVPKAFVEELLKAPTFKLEWKTQEASQISPDKELMDDLFDPVDGGMALKVPYRAFRIWNPPEKNVSPPEEGKREIQDLHRWVGVVVDGISIKLLVIESAPLHGTLVSYREVSILQEGGLTLMFKHIALQCSKLNEWDTLLFPEGTLSWMDKDGKQVLRVAPSATDRFMPFRESTDDLVRSTVFFSYMLAYPTCQVVRCEPSSASSHSVEWIEPRSYYVILPHEAITHMQKGGKSSELREILTRVAHARRGHPRRLQSERFKSKKGQVIWIKESWIGPKEWRNREDGRIYRIT